LMRLLQDGEVEPPGAPRPRKVDVRVLASTTHDLERAVAETRFRRDLCDRLYAFTLHLPPLRERGGDIALLASSFVQHFALRIRRGGTPLTESDRQRLAANAWPGNARELRSVIERAIMIAQDGKIDLDTVLPRPHQPGPQPQAAPAKVLTVEELMRIEY